MRARALRWHSFVRLGVVVRFDSNRSRIRYSAAFEHIDDPHLRVGVIYGALASGEAFLMWLHHPPKIGRVDATIKYIYILLAAYIPRSWAWRLPTFCGPGKRAMATLLRYRQHGGRDQERRGGSPASHQIGGTAYHGESLLGQLGCIHTPASVN